MNEERHPASNKTWSAGVYQDWWWPYAITALAGFFWWDIYCLATHPTPDASLLESKDYWLTLGCLLAVLWSIDRRLYHRHRVAMDRLRKSYQRNGR